MRTNVVSDLETNHDDNCTFLVSKRVYDAWGNAVGFVGL